MDRDRVVDSIAEKAYRGLCERLCLIKPTKWNDLDEHQRDRVRLDALMLLDIVNYFEIVEAAKALNKRLQKSGSISKHYEVSQKLEDVLKKAGGLGE